MLNGTFHVVYDKKLTYLFPMSRLYSLWFTAHVDITNSYFPGFDILIQVMLTAIVVEYVHE